MERKKKGITAAIFTDMTKHDKGKNKNIVVVGDSHYVDWKYSNHFVFLSFQQGVKL